MMKTADPRDDTQKRLDHLRDHGCPLGSLPEDAPYGTLAKQVTIDKMIALTTELNANLKPSRVSPELLAALEANPLNEGAILEAHGITGREPTTEDRREMLTWQLGVMAPNGDLEIQYHPGIYVVRQPAELNRPVSEEDETEAVAGGWLLWLGTEIRAKRFGSAEELAKAILETEAGR